VRISSVPGKRGIELALLVTITAFAVAAVLLAPNPINTVTRPALITLYWLPPRVLETACTGVGAVVAAVKTTVLPLGVKGALTMFMQPRAREA
jgi:hypothetical protein